MNKKSKHPSGTRVAKGLLIASVVIVVAIAGMFAYGYFSRQGDLNHIKQAYMVHIPENLRPIHHEQGLGGIDQVPFVSDSYQPAESRRQTYAELKSAFEAAGFTVEGDGSVFTNVVNRPKGITADINFYTTIGKLGNDDNGGTAIKQVDILVENL